MPKFDTETLPTRWVELAEIASYEWCERCVCFSLHLNVYLNTKYHTRTHSLISIYVISLLLIIGVLADDMGLGKTIQTISFLGWLKFNNPLDNTKRPHLIVVPASTLANWSNELKKFCPTLQILLYHGSQKERDLLRRELTAKVENLEVDVVLSTYTIFEREACKEDQSYLRRMKFEYIILDEAHCIKNPEAQRYQKLNTLNSKKRLLLSGTPVQNDIKELLALLSFLMPRTFPRSDCAVLLEAFGLDQNVKDKYAPLLDTNAPRKGY